MLLSNVCAAFNHPQALESNWSKYGKANAAMHAKAAMKQALVGSVVHYSEMVTHNHV
jgi:hypothetical protein